MASMAIHYFIIHNYLYDDEFQQTLRDDEDYVHEDILNINPDTPKWMTLKAHYFRYMQMIRTLERCGMK
ncbi:hypothetical protein RHMOL_Rhmol05G0154100 [Rhododendron molle]|uniref:Uncharacterized protein n=1 Tax=Rhododendron molle TaxID=49168 RepID=A0ACC0NQI7_RHOML|nr:hypothetical protein RHMOL_Rhmol05G0154100 [Rhododendron molle]